MPDLPTEYKAAVFESKGAPLTFKQVKLEQPTDGLVRRYPSLVLHLLTPAQVLVKVLACGVW